MSDFNAHLFEEFKQKCYEEMNRDFIPFKPNRERPLSLAVFHKWFCATLNMDKRTSQGILRDWVNAKWIELVGHRKFIFVGENNGKVQEQRIDRQPNTQRRAGAFI